MSIREVSYRGGVNKRDVLREVSLGEVSSARHLDVIKAHQTQSEAITGGHSHSSREAPSLEHLRLRRPQQLSRLLALIQPLGKR